jgi:[ribosomal protein S5]-alanine N-acetyltransferase
VSALPRATQRLTFRWWAASDGELARALWGDAQVVAHLGAVDAAARLAAELELAAQHRMQYWPIFQGDQHVGCCGLRPRAGDVLELGFHLRRAHWGHGLAQEASRAVIAFAFEELRVGALFAGHHPANEGSRRTLARLGFRYTHDELYAATGLKHPSYELRRAC